MKLTKCAPAEQVQIERRVAELIAERLADKARFDDLMSGIEPTTEIYPHLQRVVLNMMDGRLGALTRGALLIAATDIWRRIEQEAREAWGAECEVPHVSQLGEVVAYHGALTDHVWVHWLGSARSGIVELADLGRAA